jgi:1-acyl-sn-glycerol-3-phosphate acyltransferase
MTAIRRNLVVWWVSKQLTYLFAKVWFRFRIEGRKHVPSRGPCLMVSNHLSMIDPFLSGAPTQRWVVFVARDTLAKWRPMGWWMRAVGTVLIDRQAPSKDQLKALTAFLAEGGAVVLFPEGTRSRDGAVGPFRAGLELMVRRSGAPVIPMGLDGVQRAMPPGAVFPRPRKVILRVGEPWSPERVLAPGGLEALRAEVARLAHAPLRSEETAPHVGTGPEPVRTDS